MRVERSIASPSRGCTDVRRLRALLAVSLVIILGLCITNYLALYNDALRIAVKAGEAELNTHAVEGQSAAELAQIALLLGVTSTDAVANVKYLLENNQRIATENATTQRQLAATRTLHQDLSANYKNLEARYSHLEKSKAEMEVRTKAAARRLSQNIATRTSRGLARHVGGAAGESIPVIGTAVVASMLALDVKEACDLMKDVNEMNRSLGLELEDEQTICGAKIPDEKQLAAEVTKNWRAAYQAAIAVAGNLPSAPNVSWSDVKLQVCAVTTVPMVCP